MRGRFIEPGRAASVEADGQLPEANVDALGIDRNAAGADGRDQPPPVGIAARPGGFDQRRVGDGAGNLERVGVRGRALDVQLDDVRHALAIGHDLAGDGGADLVQGGGEGRVFGFHNGSACARSEQQHGVVG